MRTSLFIMGLLDRDLFIGPIFGIQSKGTVLALRHSNNSRRSTTELESVSSVSSSFSDVWYSTATGSCPKLSLLLLCMGNQTYGNNDLQYWNMQKVGIKSENIFGCKYFIAVSFTSVTIILVARISVKLLIKCGTWKKKGGIWKREKSNRKRKKKRQKEREGRKERKKEERKKEKTKKGMKKKERKRNCIMQRKLFYRTTIH